MKKVLCVMGVVLLLAACNSEPKDNGETVTPGKQKDPAVGENPFGKTALHKAVTAGDVEKVKTLLGGKADLNEKDKFGDTALHVAVSRGSVEIAGLLLDKGADPNAKDSRGETPLHDAVTDGNVEMVKLLLEKGADVNTTDEDGKNPLDRAKSEEIKRLLRK